MRRLAAAAAALTVAACGTTPTGDVTIEAGAPPSSTTSTSHRPQAADPTFVDWDGVARIHAHQQAAARAARSRPRPAAPVAGPAGTGETRRVSSTAHCLTGTTASGVPARWGTAAMNGVPLGSVWRVHGGGTYVITDRIGHSSGFDIAMPGDCAAAGAYGRRTITVGRIG